MGVNTKLNLNKIPRFALSCHSNYKHQTKHNQIRVLGYTRLTHEHLM